jgi:hypothetical protein
MRVFRKRWLPLALTTSAAFAIWALAAAHGYACCNWWQSTANRRDPETAETSHIRCHRLPPLA